MDRICPLAGAVYQNKQLLQKHLASAKREVLRLVAQLTSEELKAILKKDEPQTFKIGGLPLERPAAQTDGLATERAWPHHFVTAICPTSQWKQCIEGALKKKLGERYV